MDTHCSRCARFKELEAALDAMQSERRRWPLEYAFLILSGVALGVLLTVSLGA